MHGLISRARSIWRILRRRSAFEAEMEEEFRLHLELRTEDLIRSGLSPSEAARRATFEFGGTERYKEEARAALGLRGLDELRRDVRYAARSLRRSPGFALVTVATLALAIGSTTAVFSVVDAVLLDPLPFQEADRLVSIRATFPGSHIEGEVEPAAEFYVQYRENADLLEDLGLHNTGSTVVRTEDRVDILFLTVASPSFFTTLGAQPVLGRLPTPEDAAYRVVVISHWLWTSWFGADPAVIGRSYEIFGMPRTVIGVLGPEFRFPDERTAGWINASIGDPDEIRLGQFGVGFVGRMAPGTDHEELAEQLAPLARRIPERFGGSPEYARLIERHRPVVRSLEEEFIGDVATPLWLLLGTVGVVLLIACANVANLFIARAESRRHDLAVRQALGAGRAALVRSQMAEALLLAALGGAGGALLAWIGIPVLIHMAPERVPNLNAAGLNVAALLFTGGISVLAACAFGLLPSIRFSKPGRVGGYRLAGAMGSAHGRLSRHALVVVQTASALVLLVASGLLVRSFWELRRVDPGYDTEDVFAFRYSIGRPDLEAWPAYARLHREVADRIAALPRVESVGFTRFLPLYDGTLEARFVTEQIVAGGRPAPLVSFTVVGGDYFETMGIALLAGRGFGPGDDAPGSAGAVVSRSAAERLWPGVDPLGRRFRFTSDSTVWQRFRSESEAGVWHTVLGVVEDVFVNDLRQEAPDPMIYLPMVGRRAVMQPAFVVKTTRAESIAPEVRALFREVAPDLPVDQAITMEALVERSMARLSFITLMLAIAAALAMILGAIGLYGVLSYLVSQRTREFAVRIALGAEAPAVRRMVVLEGGRVTLVGIALGLLAAVGLTRALGTLLFGVTPLDAPTFVAMSGVMLAVAVLASYVPARRATRVDSVVALRTE